MCKLFEMKVNKYRTVKGFFLNLLKKNIQDFMTQNKGKTSGLKQDVAWRACNLNLK